jgi:asparagine synthase (glutamine-hydrolysing)
MCGIAGIIDFYTQKIPDLTRRLAVMNELQAHRGPDGQGQWEHPKGYLGFAHRRLAIIDLVSGSQPMTDSHGNWITFNGEIYNFCELRKRAGGK